MIKIDNLSKEYRIDKNSSEQVLKGISLELDSGFNVLYGPSGCGKSTLLNIISGLDCDYTGTIEVSNKNLKQINLDAFHKNEVGFVFQNFNLVNHLTVFENIMISLFLDPKRSKKENTQIANKLLADVGLSKYKNKYPTQLSGGQKQRVAIARALTNEPTIIIADEPTGALDTKTGLEILTILKALADSGKIVIVVTHDEKVASYADKIYRLLDGDIASLEVINEQTSQFMLKESKSKVGLFKTLSIGYKNFASRKFRNILVSLGSSIGIIGILLSLGLGAGIENGVKSVYSSIFSPNTVTVLANAPGGHGSFGPPTVDISPSQVKEIRTLLEKEGISEIYEDTYYETVFLEFDGKKVLADNSPFVASLQKLDYNEERQEKYSVEDETLLVGNQLDDQKNQIYITKNLAATLLQIDVETVTSENTKSLIGKELTFEFTIRNDLDIKTFNTSSVINGILEADTAPTLIYGSKTTFDNFKKVTGESPKIFSITSYAQDVKSAEAIAEKYKNNEDYSFSTLGDVLKQISSFTSAITVTLAFVAGLSLIVAAVMIAIVLYIGVIERTKEIGVLRALGYRGLDIRRLFLTEAFLIITIANLIAIGISLAIQYFANPAIAELTTFDKPFDIAITQIFMVYALTLVIAIISGLYPASKAAKVDPVESLRTE